MKYFTDFYSAVLLHVGGAPFPLVNEKLIDAAREFCERTRCWRDVQTFRTNGDEDELSCAPPDAAILELEEVWFDGHKLARVPFKDVDPASWPEDWQRPHSGISPVCVSQANHNAIVIAPKAAGTVRASMFLIPTPDAQTLPDVLYDRFREAVANGAIARLCALPDQPYSDFNKAAAFTGLFEAACDQNFRFNKRGQQRAPTRVRPSWF